MPTLQKQFQALEKFCRGTLGVAAFHIETNKKIKFNADQRFLMCSTYKVAIATYLLVKVERGEINLNDLYVVTETDFLPGMISSLNQLNYDVGQHISVHSLLRLMLQESCNTSAAIIFKLIGGPYALKAYLDQINLQDISMDFYTVETFAAWEGIKNLPKNCTVAQFHELERAVPTSDVLVARKKFKAEIEETGHGTATPEAMTALLVKIVNHELISTKSTDLLLQIMSRCKTGPLRLMGLLPPHTQVAHKTGSLTGYTNDIGIITLPHAAGRVAISVYIKNSETDLTKQERVIAEVARTIYDYFLFSGD